NFTLRAAISASSAATVTVCCLPAMFIPTVNSSIILDKIQELHVAILQLENLEFGGGQPALIRINNAMGQGDVLTAWRVHHGSRQANSTLYVPFPSAGADPCGRYSLTPAPGQMSNLLADPKSKSRCRANAVDICRIRKIRSRRNRQV